MAYNSAVRKSKKAWGFINVQSIHETAGASVSAEDKAAGSWTFRRKENLGLWAACVLSYFSRVFMRLTNVFMSE